MVERMQCVVRTSPRRRRMGFAALLLFFLCATGTASPSGAQESLTWKVVKAAIRLQYPDVTHVTTEQLAAWMAQPDTQLVVLDARAPEEYAVSHIPGARLAPDTDTALERLAGVPKTARVVVYCAVGYRSSDLAAQLAEAGYVSVSNLEGSIFQWANEGRPLVARDEPAERVHPFDRLWGRLLDRSLWADVPLEDTPEENR